MTTSQQILFGLGNSKTPKTFKYVLGSTDYGTMVLHNTPEGWDGAELTFIRDPKYKGVLETFSTNEFKFVKEGRDYIKTAYNKKGIDYEITITIYLLNLSTFQYQQYFIGKIDLSTYSIDSIYASCEIVPTGFKNTILNRASMNVDLLNTKFIGGGDGSMAQLIGMPTTLSIPPYSASKNADWVVYGVREGIPISYYHYVPMTVNSSDFTESSATSQTLDDTTPFFTSADANTVSVKGNIKVEITNNDIDGINYSINIRLYKNTSQIKLYSDSGSGFNDVFNFAVDESISLILNDELSFQAILTHNGIESRVELGYFDSSLTISETVGTPLDGTEIDSFPIYEFTSRVLQLISGKTNPLYSDLLGRTDSVPESYTSDGDGSLMCMTKGQWIRAFPIEEGGTTIQTFNGSLDDTFDTLNGLLNIGLGFETISNVEKVRIEKESYFFDITGNANYPATETEAYETNQILDLSSHVTDEILETKVLPEWYSNEIESGYQNFEYEIIQGVKEFNTKSIYATPLKAIKNKLDLKATYRYDTQGVNKLREKPYSSDPTEDVNGDNDVFGFDVKRLGVFTVKTDEDFTLVTGGIDPEQCYNLDYTPRRNIERHGNRIRSMQFADGDELQFLETDKNSRLVTQKSTETSPKYENADITMADKVVDSVTVPGLNKGYWIPEAYIFEAPVDISVITAIQTNPRGVIKVADDKYGWILEVQTNNENNKGQFKLLKVDLDNVKVKVNL